MADFWSARNPGSLPVRTATGGAAGQGPYGRTIHEVSCTISLEFDPGGAFQQWGEQLVAFLDNPVALSQLLRQAVAQTILKNIRQRFVQGLPNAMEMQSVPNAIKGHSDQKRARRNRRRDEAFMERVIKMQEAISEHELNGDHAMAASGRAKFVELQQEWYEELNTDPKGGAITPHELSSGLFRQYAQRILSMMTDAASMGTSVGDDGSIIVSIGNAQALNAIKTPSATEHVLKRGKTGSSLNIMWRHLEFGTGIYGTDPYGSIQGSHRKATRANNAHRKSILDGADAEPGQDVSGVQPGMWWYSRNPPNGLLLKGSKGVHALRDRNNLVYGDDVTLLEQTFGRLMFDALATRHAV